MAPADAVTFVEAMKFFGPIVGAVCIAAIALAYFGAQRPPAPPAEKPPPTLGIQALLADHMVMERFTAELKRLADAAEDIAKVGARLADMMDIARAVERLRRNDDD